MSLEIRHSISLICVGNSLLLESGMALNILYFALRLSFFLNMESEK